MRNYMLMALVMAASIAAPTTTFAAFVNVRSYGATGDGVTNDVLAVQNAIDAAVAAGGGEVYFPTGTYLLNASLEAHGSVRLRGDGQRSSVLRFDFAVGKGTAGLYFVSWGSSVNRVLNIRGLSFIRAQTVTGGPLGGPAIYAEWPKIAPTVTYAHGGGLTTVIEDVHIGSDPWPSETAYWDTGIRLRNATNPKIATFNIQGPGAAQTYAGGAGIQIEGSPNDVARSVTVSVHDGTITGFQRGLQMSGNRSEGLHAQSLMIRDVRWGLELITMGPGTSITTCDISAQWRGIMLFDSAGDIAITNNFINRDTDQFFVGIQIYNYSPARRNRILGNIITSEANTFQPHYAISAAQDVGDTIILGNISYWMSYGIFLEDAAVARSILMSNLNAGAGITWIDNGTNTLPNPYLW